MTSMSLLTAACQAQSQLRWRLALRMQSTLEIAELWSGEEGRHACVSINHFFIDHKFYQFLIYSFVSLGPYLQA